MHEASVAWMHRSRSPTRASQTAAVLGLTDQRFREGLLELVDTTIEKNPRSTNAYLARGQLYRTGFAGTSPGDWRGSFHWLIPAQGSKEYLLDQDGHIFTEVDPHGVPRERQDIYKFPLVQDPVAGAPRLEFAGLKKVPVYADTETSGMDWSADGTTLVYGTRFDGGELWMNHQDDAFPIPLQQAVGDWPLPAWSPHLDITQSRIAFDARPDSQSIEQQTISPSGICFHEAGA